MTKKFITVVTIFALMFMAVPFTSVQAKGETWINPGNNWHYLDGTDIKVFADGDTLRIMGTGAIPDYDYWSLAERPWNSMAFQYLMIDDTVTGIGSYAFYGMENLRYIHMSTKTFIADATAFDKIAYKPIFRLYGEEEVTRMIGNIPFTSYDSIKRMAQINYTGACYVLDTPAIARQFQTSTNPTICNVYSAGTTDAPWNELDDNGNGNVITPICRITSPNPDAALIVSAQNLYQGDACYEAFSAFMGDYIFATAFNIIVTREKNTLSKTDTPLQYTLTVPAEYRLPGRTFRLLAIGSGVMYTYDDLDTSDDTITFLTDTPTTAYALIYQ